MTLSLRNNKRPASLSPLNGDVARFRDELDRTFDRFFTDPFSLGDAVPPALRPGWYPTIDVSETDAEITVCAEAPGVAAKDLDISIAGRTLIIAGRKEESSEKRGEHFCHCERRFGSFRRSIELPETANPDRVTAESDNGVVTIHIAKDPRATPKHVEVKPAAKKVAVG